MFTLNDLHKDDIIALDLEIQDAITSPTQWNDTDKMRVSICVVYNFKDDTYSLYGESDLDALRARIAIADLIVTFNGNKFDLPIIYHNPNRTISDSLKACSFDILAETWKALNLNPDEFTSEHKGYSLASIARGTIGRGKLDHGENAVFLYRARNWPKLIEYCIDDVYLTKELFKRIRGTGSLNVCRYGRISTINFKYKHGD